MGGDKESDLCRPEANKQSAAPHNIYWAKRINLMQEPGFDDPGDPSSHAFLKITNGENVTLEKVIRPEHMVHPKSR